MGRIALACATVALLAVSVTLAVALITQTGGAAGTVLPMQPTADQIERAVSMLVPMDENTVTVNGRVYECGYLDDSHNTEDLTAPFEASLLWCLHAPELERHGSP